MIIIVAMICDDATDADADADHDDDDDGGA